MPVEIQGRGVYPWAAEEPSRGLTHGSINPYHVDSLNSGNNRDYYPPDGVHSVDIRDRGFYPPTEAAPSEDLQAIPSSAAPPQTAPSDNQPNKNEYQSARPNRAGLRVETANSVLAAGTPLNDEERVRLAAEMKHIQSGTASKSEIIHVQETVKEHAGSEALGRSGVDGIAGDFTKKAANKLLSPGM